MKFVARYILAALLGGISSPAFAETPAAPHVFFGTVPDPGNLADPAKVRDLLASGKIGLYGHTNGIFTLARIGKSKAVAQLWEQKFQEVAEFGVGAGAARSSMTVVNSGDTDLRLAYGTELKDEQGRTWTVTPSPLWTTFGGMKDNCEQWTERDQFYLIPAHAKISCNISIEAAQDGPVVLAAHSRLTFEHPVRGLEIGNVLGVMSGPGPKPAHAGSNGADTPEIVNFWTRPEAFRNLFPNRGHAVGQADVNTNGFYAASDVESWKRFVDTGRQSGVKNFAPITQTSYAAFLGTTSPFNTIDIGHDKYLREAALYGGGISYDMPASWIRMQSVPESYLQWYINTTRWAHAHGLRVSWINSPVNPEDGRQLQYSTDTQWLIQHLRDADALPDQWIVENYRSACGATGIGNDTTREPVVTQCGNRTVTIPYSESLNAIALMLVHEKAYAPFTSPLQYEGLLRP